MFRETTVAGEMALTLVVCTAVLLGQQTPATPRGSAGPEFPVTMQQNLAAGVAAVGTRVQAKLVIATLVNGTVVPKDAILSGEVIESVAKSVTDASRLAIRMDSVQWQNESVPLKVYLTAWYYPTEPMLTQNSSNESADARSPRNWNGTGAYPDPNSPASQPFPGRHTERGSELPPWSSPESSIPISQHRVLMKNVESVRNRDGTVTLISKRSSIKIDKRTTYVLAPAGLLPVN